MIGSAIPSVSVCIVTYNSADVIGACLDGLKQQTWPNTTVIVVDNASGDHTISEITSRSELDVRLICNDANLGYAKGQNQAIRSISSDYVLTLNPDVTLEPGYIEELVLVMEKDKHIGSATGLLCLDEQQTQVDTCGLIMDRTRNARERGSGLSTLIFTESSEVFGVSAAAAIYSRSMIDEISVEDQFFDEDFFAYKEDVDVAWRARRLGWKSWYVASAKGIHLRNWGKRSDRKRIPLSIRQNSYKNRYLMIIKNETFNYKWWVNLPRLIAYELMLHGFLLLRDPKVLNVWFTLYPKLTAALRKRKDIHQLSELKEM